MRLAGSRSWQIRVDQWSQRYEIPLWVRAAERIESAGALVPGPLDIDPVPAPSPGDAESPGDAARRAAELTEGWAAWWEAALHWEPPDPVVLRLRGLAGELDGSDVRPLDLSFMPPDFDGLRPWPALHGIATRRWLEAHEWNNGRKRAGVDAFVPTRPDNGRVVREVEAALGRKVRPFVLELMVIPVRDDEVRRVREGRYLVPERLYGGPGWSDVLQRLVVRLGS
jgi:hypothetical protein